MMILKPCVSKKVAKEAPRHPIWTRRGQYHCT